MKTYTKGHIAAFTDDSRDIPHTNLVGVVPHTHCVLALPGHDKREPNIERLVSCWNACVDIENPAAIKALVEAAKEAARVLWEAYGDDSEAFTRLSAALRALDGEDQ